MKTITPIVIALLVIGTITAHSNAQILGLSSPTGEQTEVYDYKNVANWCTEGLVEWDFNLSSTFYSAYVAPNGANIYDDPVIQTSFTAAHNSGFYANVWQSNPLSDKFFDNDAPGTEIDFTVGWAGTIIEEIGLNADIGASYWALGDLYDWKEDTIFCYAKFSKDFDLAEGYGTLTPQFAIKTYTDTGNDGFGGIVTDITVTHNYDITEKICLRSSIGALYDDGVYRGEPGFVGKVSTCLGWKIAENVSIQPAIIEAWQPLGQANKTKDFELRYGIGFSIGF